MGARVLCSAIAGMARSYGGGPMRRSVPMGATALAWHRATN